MISKQIIIPQSKLWPKQTQQYLIKGDQGEILYPSEEYEHCALGLSAIQKLYVSSPAGGNNSAFFCNHDQLLLQSYV